MPIPRLRPLDLVAAEWNGQRVVCARDYEGLLDSPVLLPLPTVLVAMLLDGRREMRDVQAEFARITGGIILPSWDLDRIVGDLDANGLLDSPALEDRRRDVAAAYRAAPCRPAAHAGRSYPADPESLTKQLRSYLDVADAVSDRSEWPASPLRGILAPHIDFERGGPVYGRAYRMLTSLEAGTCVIILGVAHSGPPAPYILTDKDFETPLGLVPVDRSLLDQVRSRYPYEDQAWEMVHRGEHSIEFQMVFLAHLARNRGVTVLPVLCGNLETYAGAGQPAVLPEVEAFVTAVREAIATLGRPVCIIGGVDLSHVGPRFGDAEAVGPLMAAEARGSDLRALDQVVDGNAAGFWQTVMADNNQRRICGLSAIYTALRILEPVRGRILGYDQGLDPAGGLVGFSAVVFTGAETSNG
jgi:MEMO1 family protein